MYCVAFWWNTIPDHCGILESMWKKIKQTNKQKSPINYNLQFVLYASNPYLKVIHAHTDYLLVAIHLSLHLSSETKMFYLGFPLKVWVYFVPDILLPVFKFSILCTVYDVILLILLFLWFLLQHDFQNA